MRRALAVIAAVFALACVTASPALAQAASTDPVAAAPVPSYLNWGLVLSDNSSFVSFRTLDCDPDSNHRLCDAYRAAPITAATSQSAVDKARAFESGAAHKCTKPRAAKVCPMYCLKGDYMLVQGVWQGKDVESIRLAPACNACLAGAFPILPLHYVNKLA